MRASTTVAASAPAASPPPPAAARVFAIPELLEKILLLAIKESDYEDYEGRWLLFEPMPGHHELFSLIAIQRVSKDFLNTIQGSVKLKQLIYRAPLDAKLKTDRKYDRVQEEIEGPDMFQDHRPLQCLLNRLRFKAFDGAGWGFHFYVRTWEMSLGHIVVFLNGSIVHPYTSEGESFRSRFGGKLENVVASAFQDGWAKPEASWRRIKICSSKKNNPVRLCISTCASWRDVQPNIGEPAIKWNLSGDATLGQVYDLIVQFFSFIDTQRAIRAEQDREFAHASMKAMGMELGEDAYSYEIFGSVYGNPMEDRPEDPF